MLKKIKLATSDFTYCGLFLRNVTMNEGPLYLIFIMLICMMAFLLSNSIQLNFNFF